MGWPASQLQSLVPFSLFPLIVPAHFECSKRNERGKEVEMITGLPPSTEWKLTCWKAERLETPSPLPPGYRWDVNLKSWSGLKKPFTAWPQLASELHVQPCPSTRHPHSTGTRLTAPAGPAHTVPRPGRLCPLQWSFQSCSEVHFPCECGPQVLWRHSPSLPI